MGRSCYFVSGSLLILGVGASHGQELPRRGVSRDRLPLAALKLPKSEFIRRLLVIDFYDGRRGVGFPEPTPVVSGLEVIRPQPVISANALRRFVFSAHSFSGVECFGVGGLSGRGTPPPLAEESSSTVRSSCSIRVSAESSAERSPSTQVQSSRTECSTRATSLPSESSFQRESQARCAFCSIASILHS